MKVVVLDTATCSAGVAALLPRALELRVKVAVSDLVYARELQGAAQGERLRRLGLRVETLASMDAAAQLRRAWPRVALLDACELALAVANSWALLTADPYVAGAARSLGVPLRTSDWLAAEIARREAESSDLWTLVRHREVGHPLHAYACTGDHLGSG